MKNKLIYLLLAAFAVYVEIMYEWKAGPAVISAIIIFPFLCLLSALYLKYKLKINVSAKVHTVDCGDEIPVGITVDNWGIFPASCVKVRLICQYAGSREKDKKTIVLTSLPGEIIDAGCTMQAGYCGRVLVSAQRARVYDCLRLFSFVIKGRKQSEVTVLPRPVDIFLQVSERTRMFPIDSEEYSKVHSGDDPSEVFDVREYRPGDRMSSVHWKLSARGDDLFVKEFSLPVGAAVVLILSARGEKMEPAVRHAWITAAVSISYALHSESCIHFAAWRDTDGEVVRRRISDDDSFYDFLYAASGFMEEMPGQADEEEYRMTYPGEQYCVLMELNEELGLMVNQEPVFSVKPEAPVESLKKMELYI